MKYVVLIALLLLTGCEEFPMQQMKVPDLERPMEISLKKGRDQRRVCYLKIEISGYATGVVTLELLLDGKPYQKRMVSGHYQTAIYTDWYDDDAKIRLEVSDGVSRSCKINYQFLEFTKPPNQ